MKISIAMCTYNGARYVRQQLESIASQTRPPHELIVCDDKSSDNTVEIVKSFASQALFPVRLYVNEQNLGTTKNFEQAIELCTGDVIALSDQDDVWHPGKLACIEARLLSAPAAGFVFTDAEVVDKDLRSLGYRLWERTFKRSQQKLFEEGRAFDVLLQHHIVTGATMAFRSQFKKLILPVPTDITVIHDGWIAILIAAVADLTAIPDSMIKYRQHTAQQIGMKSHNKVHTKSERDAYYLAEAHKLDTIRQRLLTVKCDFGKGENRSSLDSRIIRLQRLAMHFHMRAALPDRRLLRVPLILKELLMFRYHLYSKGLLSAAKDFSL